MEVFSLLKYWRGSGGGRSNSNATTTTIATIVRETAMKTDEEDDDDDGPFFDLEFTVPEETDEDGEQEHNCEGNDRDTVDDGEEGESTAVVEEKEFNISGDGKNPNISSLSLSDDSRFVKLDSSGTNSKPQFPISLLKSATKIRVFLLGFRKPKSTASEKMEMSGGSASAPATPEQNQPPRSSKSFTIKFKVEEVPIVSLFTRENSSRFPGNKLQKQNSESEEATSDEKLFSKDHLQKYLKMIKPFYVHVSRRYGEKLKFSGQLGLRLGKNASNAKTSPISSPTTTKQGNIPAGLRVVCKHLGKSRSASSTVAAMPVQTFQQRRDDSLLQQQDGIQNAILHCKRSFNSSRDSDSILLSRSTSDPSHDKNSSTESMKEDSS